MPCSHRHLHRKSVPVSFPLRRTGGSSPVSSRSGTGREHRKHQREQGLHRLGVGCVMPRCSSLRRLRGVRRPRPSTTAVEPFGCACCAASSAFASRAPPGIGCSRRQSLTLGVDRDQCCCFLEIDHPPLPASDSGHPHRG